MPFKPRLGNDLRRRVGPGGRVFSGNGPDGPYFGDMGLEIAFKADLEGHSAGGASDAGPVEADFDDAVLGEADEFDIAAVGLDGWSDKADDLGDAVEDLRLVGILRRVHAEW